jgi:hypothetical protein
MLCLHLALIAGHWLAALHNPFDHLKKLCHAERRQKHHRQVAEVQLSYKS